jgi:uncharacterized protein YfeS
MDFWVQGRTYDTGGASAIFTCIGDLLTIRVGDHGTAVESIEICVHLRSNDRKIQPTLEDLFDQYHEYLKTLPVVIFRRRLKRIEIGFLSEHFTADDNESSKLSVEKRRIAMKEVGDALRLVKRRVKPSDDFNVDRFLMDVDKATSRNIDNLEAWETIHQEARKIQLAIRAKKSPWELLEIDWAQYHPRAREVLDDPFFWECADDLAPHGNDTGADLLEDYRRWDRRNQTRSPMVFFKKLMRKWGIEPIDWPIEDEETVLRISKNDPVAMSLCNEAAIALAFAVLKMRSRCPSNVIRLALTALAREAILVKWSKQSGDIRALCNQAIAKMKQKLEAQQPKSQPNSDQPGNKL